MHSVIENQGTARPVVTPWEARVLRLLEIIFGLLSLENLPEVFARPVPMARQWTAGGIRLVQQRLRRGMVRTFARDGWRSERFLSHGQVLEGRLWQRHPVETLALTFSSWSLYILAELASESPLVPQTDHSFEVSRVPGSHRREGPHHGTRSSGPSPSLRPGHPSAQWEQEIDPQPLAETPRVTFGDRLLAILAWPVIGAQGRQAEFARVAPWRADPLLRSLNPSDLALFPTDSLINFADWFHPERCWVLEAWQRRIAAAWQRHTTNGLPGPAPFLPRNSASQEVAGSEGNFLPQRLVERYLDAANQAGRRDLGFWILRTLPKQGIPSSVSETAPASQTGTTIALVEGLATLTRWRSESRRIGYFDDGYSAAQHLLREWERLESDF